MEAVVIGGSSGIGLAISKQLIEKGYYIHILSRTPPESGILPEDRYRHVPFDMNDLDEELILSLAAEDTVDLLMITAGFGRVAEFEHFSSVEIEKMMTVNATSTLRVLRLFYDRIKNSSPFCCGVMGSISGLLSTPLSAVYAASKAAVFRFIESVNIELEVSGYHNRITNISPASFAGSRFYGGKNQLDLLANLADEIIQHVFHSAELFIPQYEETFKQVIERYHRDPHEYGIHSYQYKKDSGRINEKSRLVVGYLSGTFDLFHVGHLNLLRNAKKHCDYLIVGVHASGAWKGKETFIPFEERKQIIGACKYVDKVVQSCPEDADAWSLYHYDKLFVGSDYKGSERFNRYEEYFKDKGVEIVYFPYTQSTSSTQIRQLILSRNKDHT